MGTTSTPRILFLILCVVSVSVSQVTPPASVFHVLRIKIPVNMQVCRSVCTQWRTDAYVATILTAKENAEVAAQVTGLNQVLLGGQRGTTSSPFRWTEGPLGRVISSNGVVFWTGGAANSAGVCTAAMYCNFDTDQPDAYRPTETSLSMFGSNGDGRIGKWNDINANNMDTNGCACRWDPFVFEVFPVSSTSVSLSYCRWCCATWRPGAYVATILTAEENAMVYAMLWSNWTFAALGATRQPDGSGVESTRFRWTEGPLGAADGGLGTLLWSRTGTMWNGTGVCAPGLYCNFNSGRPDNAAPGNQVQLVTYGPAVAVSFFLRATWDDRSYTGVASTSFDGCVCRHDSSPSSTASVTLSAEATSSPSVSATPVTDSTRLSLSVTNRSTTVSGDTSRITALMYNASRTRTSPTSFLSHTFSSQRSATSFQLPTVTTCTSLSDSTSLSSKSLTTRLLQDTATRSLGTVSCTAQRSSTGSQTSSRAVPVVSTTIPSLGATAITLMRVAERASVFSPVAASAAVVGRIAATQQLVNCGSGSAGGGGLLGLSFADGGDPAHVASARALARGAVAGNTLLLCSAFMCILAVAVVFAVGKKCTLREGILRVALPSSLHPVWMAALQSTVAAASPLLTPQRKESDAAAVAAIAAFAGGPLLLLCAFPYYANRHLHLSLVLQTLPHSKVVQPLWVSLWTSLWSRMWRWEVAETNRAMSNNARRVWLLLLEYRVLWYPALDAAVLVVVSVAGSASVIEGSVPACRSAAVGTLVVYLLQLAIVVLVKPFLVRAANIVTVVTLALSRLCVAMQVLVMFVVGPVDDLLMLSVVLQLLGIALAKIIHDASSMLSAVVRLVKEINVNSQPVTETSQCGSALCTDTSEIVFNDDNVELFAFSSDTRCEGLRNVRMDDCRERTEMDSVVEASTQSTREGGYDDEFGAFSQDSDTCCEKFNTLGIDDSSAGEYAAEMKFVVEELSLMTGMRRNAPTLLFQELETISSEWV